MARKDLPEKILAAQKARSSSGSASRSATTSRTNADPGSADAPPPSHWWQLDLGPADWRRSLRIFSFLLTSAALVAVMVFSLYSVLGQALDQLVLDQAMRSFPTAEVFAWPVARSISLLGIAFLTLLTALVAVAKRRLALGMRLVLLVVGANLTTQVIKNFLLDRPYVGVGFDLPNSLPSGHVTVAMCAALAVTAVAPQRLRVPAAFLGTAFAGAVSLSVVLLGWHRPSDVVAAVLVAFCWALLLVPHERPQGFAQRLNAWVLVLHGLVISGFLGFCALALGALKELVASLISLPRAPGAVTEAGIPLQVFHTYPLSSSVFMFGSLMALVALVGFVLHFMVLLESGHKNKHYI